MEALVHGKGLPCLQICVGSVTKALQPPLDAFSGTNSVVQNNALLLLHGALASNRLDTRRLLTISRYMWCHMDVLLVFLCLATPFEWALFPGLPIGRFTVYFPWIYNTAEVVCQGRHLSRVHQADGQLPLQQFRRCLKLIPKPKGAALRGAYIGVAPILETIRY